MALFIFTTGLLSLTVRDLFEVAHGNGRTEIFPLTGRLNVWRLLGIVGPHLAPLPA
jgi:hypothetical protein